MQGMLELVVQSGKQEGQRLLLPIGKEIVIGREEGCQIILGSTLISRRHCSLRQTPEGIWVQDLGSQNGTFVNDVAVTEPTLLTTDDLLRVGALVFVVRGVPQAKPAKKAAPTNAKAGAASEPLSDAEIAEWLTEEPSPTTDTISDTTVIRGRTAVPEPPPASVAPPPPPKPAAAPAKKFRSVKEEAADIIRRHWAAARGQQPPE